MTTEGNNRSRVLLIGLLVVAVILLAKLFYIQIVDDKYKINASNNSMVYDMIYPTRGIIYDRNEVPVAVNRPGYKVFVDPEAPIKEGQDMRRTAERIAELTGVGFASVYREITGQGKKSRYIVIGTTFDKEAVDLVTNTAVYCRCGLDPFSECGTDDSSGSSRDGFRRV